MRRADDPLLALLPLARTDLLARAIGRTLVEIDRHTAVTLDRYTDHYQQDPTEYFARVSGPTDLRFSGGLVHRLCSWPSELSLTVEDTPLPDDPDLVVLHLSETTAVPGWIRGCLGRTVVDVRVYTYREAGVDSPEARQCAVSYVLEPDTELIYGTYLHGRMSGDELLGPAELDPELIALRVSLGGRADRV